MEIPNHSIDWKLNPNVECKITLNKLKIKTPEYETVEFCRMLTDRSTPKEPTSSDTNDIHSNLEFVLDVLLNEIVIKCEEKCGLCEKYVQQLLHHIIHAHSASPDAQTVFKCDVCSSIYSSPSMLIRHRNTHSDNSDTLTNNSTSFDDLSFVTRTIESESSSSGQCANHTLQSVTVPPNNFEWNSLKQESTESQSQLEMSYPNPLGILQHMNHLSTIQNNLKQECNDLECEEDLQDPLLLQDLQVPSFVEYESTGTGFSTDFEHRTTLVTNDNSSNKTRTGEEQFQSRKFGKSFPVPSDLIGHNITLSSLKHKPYKCDVCGKCFGQRFILTRHQLMHTGQKPHKCEVCGKCFTRNSHLTQHRVTHTGEKPFRCEVCGKDFTHKQSLAVHKLTHTGENPQTYDVRDKSFYQRSHLTKHKLVHTGEKLHECNVCGKCFSKRKYLIQHELVHSGEKSHKCDVCGNCFLRKHTLVCHKLTHTRKKSFHCDVCGQRFDGRYELTNHKLKHDWQSTTTTFVNHLKEERESEEEGCQEDPFLNL